MSIVILGQILRERKEPIGSQNGDGLPFLGVSNKNGLHLAARQRPKDLSRYLKVEKNWFAYNPMRINVGSIGYASGENLCGLISPDYVVFSCNQEVYSPYLLMWLRSNAGLLEIRRNTAGSVRERLYFRSLAKVRMPLPSIERQKNIVTVKKDLDYITDEYRKTIDKKIPFLRQSILQLAVKGKLVSQDPNDEPASVLLKKIVVQKEMLPKDKKFRKIKPLPRVESDELPYKLPESWEWIRLGELIHVSSGNSLPRAKMIEGKIPVYGGNGITGYHNSYNVDKQTIVIGRVGFYCGSIHLTPSKAWVTDNAFITYYPERFVDQDFLVWLLRATNLQTDTSSTAQPVISGRKIYPLMIQLPPLKEQSRIVARINQLMALCDELVNKVTQSQTDCDELLTAIASNNESVSVKKKNNLSKTVNPNILPSEQLIALNRAKRDSVVSIKNKEGRTQYKKSGRGNKSKSKSAIPKKAREPESATKPFREKQVTPKYKSTKLTLTNAEKRFDKLDVLKAFRKAIFHQSNLDENNLLRLVGQRLGVNRLSKQIRHELESFNRTAIRRKIIAQNGDGYDSATPTINHYEAEYLTQVLRSVIRKGYEYDRAHVVTKAAEYLGFDKVSDAFAERMKAVFRIAIRRGELYRNGIYVGKA